jgi:hypothetical protein
VDLHAFIEQLKALLSADPISWGALQAVFFVSVLDFALGSIHAAVPPSTFKWQWVDAWVGDHLTKAVMISVALLLGRFAPDVQLGNMSFSVITAAAVAAAATYTAKTLASALLNLNFGGADSPPESISPDPTTDPGA